jgi:hypothetical protein
MASSGMLRRVVLTRATRSNILEDVILHIHRRENLKSYIYIYIYIYIYLLAELRRVLSLVSILVGLSYP